MPVEWLLEGESTVAIGLDLPFRGGWGREACAALAAVLERYGAREVAEFSLRGADGKALPVAVPLHEGTWADLCARVEFAQGAEEGLVALQVDRVALELRWQGTDAVLTCTAATEPTSCERLAAHVAAALTAIAEHPDDDFRAANLLTPEERALALELSTPRREPGPEGDLVTRFTAVAARTPEAVAVVAGAERTSYGELDRSSAALARALVAEGVGRGHRVGIALQRGRPLITAVLGILRAGAAYVPIDPDYPENRRREIVEGSSLKFLITEHGLPVEGFPELRTAAPEELVARDSEFPLQEVHPGDIAYVIYTSGSTGKPKGVEIEHRSAVRLFDTTAAEVRPTGLDVWTMFHSCAFDFSVWEIWGALLYGGRLVIVPFAVSRDPHAFASLIRAEGVTVLSQTPSAFTQYLAAETALDRTALRLVVLGGEAVRPGALSAWYASLVADRARLVNMYGITETTVHATWRELTAADLVLVHSPIGTPLPDLGVRLRDDQGRVPPIGVPGEILVRGPGLATGYMDAAELTAERFRYDEAGVRWYHSGDLAVLRPSGELAYLGRRDRQVKIRGFRIELGDVEAALLAHPSVGQVVALALPGASGRSVLAAFVVAGRDTTSGELKSFVRLRLPEHMVPTRLVIVPKLPLTVNGKLDTQALPALAASDESASKFPVERLTGSVAQLADIWQQVLGVRPAAGDSFFDIGGDSLSMVEMLTRAEQAGLTLNFQEVFAGRPLAELLGSVTRTAGFGAARISLEQALAGIPPEPPAGARTVMLQDPAVTDGLPLFFSPWGTGSVALLKLLPPGFAPGRRITGIEGVGLHDGVRPLFDMAGIARCAAQAVLDSGVRCVHLGGFCFGAAVVLDAARILQEHGVEVAALVLVDAEPPDPYDPGRSWSPEEFFEFRLNMLERIYGDDPAETLRRECRRGLIDEEPVERYHQVQALWAANSYVAATWQPQPFSGPVLLVVSEKHRPTSTVAAWREWLDPEQVTVLQCQDAPDTRDVFTSKAFGADVGAFLRAVESTPTAGGGR